MTALPAPERAAEVAAAAVATVAAATETAAAAAVAAAAAAAAVACSNQCPKGVGGAGKGGDAGEGGHLGLLLEVSQTGGRATVMRASSRRRDGRGCRGLARLRDEVTGPPPARGTSSPGDAAQPHRGHFVRCYRVRGTGVGGGCSTRVGRAQTRPPSQSRDGLVQPGWPHWRAVQSISAYMAPLCTL